MVISTFLRGHDTYIETAPCDTNNDNDYIPPPKPLPDGMQRMRTAADARSIH